MDIKNNAPRKQQQLTIVFVLKLPGHLQFPFSPHRPLPARPVGVMEFKILIFRQHRRCTAGGRNVRNVAALGAFEEHVLLIALRGAAFVCAKSHCPSGRGSVLA